MLDSWKVVTLGDISEVITSGSRGWAGYYSDEGAKFIRMTNLGRNGIGLLLDEMKYVQLPANNSEGSRTLLKPNDILISITAELGKIGYVPENLGESYINQHVALVRLDEQKAIPKMVAYVLSTTRARNELNRRNDAGAKSGLNLTTIQNFPILVPNRDQQSHIVKILETWDKYIELLDKKIRLKSNIKKGLMQQLLTGEKRLPGFTDGWIATSFNDCVNVKAKPKGLKTVAYEEQGIPIFDQSDSKYISGYTTLDEYSYNYSDSEPIILFGDHSRAFKLIKVKCAFGNDGIKLFSGKSGFDTGFLYYLLKNNRIPNTGYNRHFKYIKDEIFEIPDLPEQKAIARVLSSTDQEMDLLVNKRHVVAWQKKFLLNNLVSGKIRVPISIAIKIEEAVYA